MDPVYLDEGKLEDLGQLVSGAASHWSLRLFQNDIVPDHETVIEDFEEADFDGYAPQSIAFNPQTLNGDFNAIVTASLILFLMTGDSTPNDIYGWYLVSSFSGDYVALRTQRMVPEEGPPIVMAAIGNNIQLTPRVLQGDCPLES